MDRTARGSFGRMPRKLRLGVGDSGVGGARGSRV
jgi:hypothetical protein